MYSGFDALVNTASAVYVLDHMATRNARRRVGRAAMYGKRMKRRKQPNRAAARPSGTRKVVPKKSRKGVLAKRRPKYMKGGLMKTTREDPLRVTLKSEQGTNVNAWNCAYPGAVTHTTSNTLLMVVYALMRFLFKEVGINFGNFFDPILPNPLTSSGTVYIRFLSKRSTGFSGSNSAQIATNADEGIALAGDNYNELANTIASQLMILGKADVGESIDTLNWVSIGSGPVVVGQANIIPTRIYNCNELYISVKGESTVTVQNRTRADLGDDNVKLENSNIYGQPLVGKYYTFNKSRPMIKHVGDVLLSEQVPYFPYQVDSGGAYNYDQSGPIPGPPAVNYPWTPQVRDSLRKPPAGTYFENCVGTKYVRLKPGGFMTKRIEATHTFTLREWFYKFIDKWNASTGNGIANMNSYADPLSWQLGKSHTFGLERQCDTSQPTSADPNKVTVGCEHNLFMVSKCVYRPAQHAVAVINMRPPP